MFLFVFQLKELQRVDNAWFWHKVEKVDLYLSVEVAHCSFQLLKAVKPLSENRKQ